MPERASKVVPAIERLFADLNIDIVEERVLRFIIMEIHEGKSLQQALQEPYVVNNTTEAWRRHILERPEVIEAVEEEVHKKFQS